MSGGIALGEAIKMIRTARQLTQEDFSDVSSRTYLSTLERGLKSPTINKIEQIAQTMNVHPLSILTLAYANAEQRQIEDLAANVIGELRSVLPSVSKKTSK
jgi:transcriptional regulator with XRE-family HTH domain